METKVLIGRLIMASGIMILLVAIFLLATGTKRAEQAANAGKPYRSNSAAPTAFIAVGLSLNTIGLLMQRRTPPEK